MERCCPLKLNLSFKFYHRNSMKNSTVVFLEEEISYSTSNQPFHHHPTYHTSKIYNSRLVWRKKLNRCWLLLRYLKYTFYLLVQFSYLNSACCFVIFAALLPATINDTSILWESYFGLLFLNFLCQILLLNLASCSCNYDWYCTGFVRILLSEAFLTFLALCLIL